MEKMLIRLQKNAEKNTNKMRLPKEVVEKFGRSYYMEIYENHIKLILYYTKVNQYYFLY